MKLSVINIDGKKISDIDLSDKVFSLKPNKNIIATVVDWQINNAKPRTAKTKQRSEVIGSTAKIYAQKGTGGARHSSRKAPLFVGGGVAHGPKGNIYRTKKINKKLKKLGLMNVLSEKIKENSLKIVEDFKKKINKTKEFNSFLIKNNIKNLLLISDKNSIINIEKSARNIPNLKLIEPTNANVYDILKYKNVVFTTTSVKTLEEKLSKWKKSTYMIASYFQ